MLLDNQIERLGSGATSAVLARDTLQASIDDHRASGMPEHPVQRGAASAGAFGKFPGNVDRDLRRWFRRSRIEMGLLVEPHEFLLEVKPPAHASFLPGAIVLGFCLQDSFGLACNSMSVAAVMVAAAQHQLVIVTARGSSFFAFEHPSLIDHASGAYVWALKLLLHAAHASGCTEPGCK